tara:strand:+ start:13156 stop:13518 length:363 start_codon:yes stop_codon:yes gene_type:complete
MTTLLKKLMNEVKSNIDEIQIEELNNQINIKKELFILDVRSKDKWQEGHLPGAVSCERGMLELNIEELCPKLNQEIVIYCGGGTRSALSCESLQRMGYENVKSLAGGFRSWSDAKFPVER